jgi:putative ABC transport system ATP-binding protein
MNDKILECRDLRKTFKAHGKEIPVLAGVNLSVNAGEIVVIRGMSGAGKSTLFWLLSGLDNPTSGEMLFNGRSLASMSSRELVQIRRDKIGIIFQDFNLVASLTALENVESALRHTGVSSKMQHTKALQLLDDLKLSDRLDNFPSQLSIGQQQRIAIARTLANVPVLVLADEPTGSVDPETAKEIVSMLIRPVREKGTALVVATHGNFPLEVADRVLLLRDGTLSETAGASVGQW